MTYSELINIVAEDSGITKAAAKQAVESICREITGALANGESLEIPKLGCFRTVAYGPRDERNPATGDILHIPGGRQVRFTPSLVLKSTINH